MADEGEDMWHVYNLIAAGDELKATTFRKVQQESATGSTSNTRRVRTTIRLQVEATDFDASACLLRLVAEMMPPFCSHSSWDTFATD